jgi:transposase
MKSPILKPGKRHSVDAELLDLRKENRKLRTRIGELERRNAELESDLADARESAEAWRVRYFKLEERSRAEIQSLSLKLAQAEAKIEEITITLAWHQKHTFGESSEQHAVDPSAKPEAPKEQKQDSKPRGKRTGAIGHGRIKRNGISEETNDIPVPPEKRHCKCCGKPYRLLPKKDSSTVLEFLQDLYKIVDLGSTYVKDCACAAAANNPRLVRSEAPPRVFPRASLGPELWTDILVEKFLLQKPLQRISQKYLMLGATVPVSTICSGLKKIDALVDLLALRMRDHAKGAGQWNMDETTWRVFGEGKQKWWLWVVVTPDCVAFILDETRSSEVPEAFFQGVSEGILITDRYSAYKALKDGIQKAYCWAHVRRDFIKILDGCPDLRAWAEGWIKQIDDLFKENAKRTALLTSKIVHSKEDIFLANYKVKFLLEEMEKQLQQELKGKLKERPRKVLESLKRHWTGLTVFRDNPSVPMDNNAAERALRNPVVGRKNYYGSGSAWSGHLSAKLFTIFQTWLMNGLEPISLLQDFLRCVAKNRGQPPPVEDYLPWTMSEERKAEFQFRR